MAAIIKIVNGQVRLLRLDERKKELFGDTPMDEIAARLEAGEDIDWILNEKQQRP